MLKKQTGRRRLVINGLIFLFFWCNLSFANEDDGDGAIGTLNQEVSEPDITQQAPKDSELAEPIYLNWYSLDKLNEDEREELPSFCHGKYLSSHIVPITDEHMQADADDALISKNGDTQMAGSVVLRQEDRILRSDLANWNNQQRQAFLDGNINIESSQISVIGDQAIYNEGTQEIYVDRAEFSVINKHLRGTAKEFLSQNETLLTLENTSITFCEPGNNDWSIAASELHLNQESGIGTAWHAKMRIKDVPVFYIPYYRFPIGDQRMTGFLDPSFSISTTYSDDLKTFKAEDIQIPFYINIAPNLDNTITAHHVLEHGMLWENQFRHKTSLLGDGELNLGYLAKDKETKEKRWLVNYLQSGTWGTYWRHDWEFNNLSDKDYISDLNSIYQVPRAPHLPSKGSINFNNPDVYSTNLSGGILLESFKTIDERLALNGRPYRRLPQLSLIWSKGNRITEYFKQEIQLTRFNRESTGIVDNEEQFLTGFDALNSHRLVSDTSLAYPKRWPFGFITPKVEYRYRAYHLYDEEVEDIEPNYRFSAPRYSLSGGIAFEREFEFINTEYIQTLEPRIFYVYSPYRENQTDVPTFDTKATTVTYNSLFYGDRFTGYDRLADLRQVSGGVTSRFIREDGLEQLRVSLGRIWFMADRRVTLKETDLENLNESQTRGLSSTIGEAELNFTESLSVFSFAEWDPYQNYARQERYGIRYLDKNNHMFGITNSKTDSQDEERETRNYTNQLDISFFWSLTDRWAVFGKQLRDLKTYEEDDTQPEDRMLEALAGIEYQNCCWRAQLVYREMSRINQDITEDNPFSTDKRFGWLLSIQLKGLTTLGANTKEMLDEDIYGYTRRIYYDH